MYSYEDLIRAVKLYINCGYNVAYTVCKLGYPSRQILIQWVKELYPLNEKGVEIF